MIHEFYINNNSKNIEINRNYSIPLYNKILLNLKSVFFQKKICKKFLFKINLFKSQNIKQSKFDVKKTKWEKKIFKGNIKHNFFYTAQKLGLNNTEINKIIKVLHWKINFVKLHNNDKFSVLILQKNINNNLKTKLVGMHFYFHKKHFYAFLSKKNGKFYDENALSISNKHMIYPMTKIYPISSKFNLRRFNPISKKISPHHGIDFAVPIGTKILSVDNGYVMFVKHNSITAGNYIAIRHKKYITRYMHLNKILVKVGDKIKRGDCIALSGNTGYSTGPHLHFEILIKNKAVDPLKINFVDTAILNNKDRKEFLFKIKHLKKQLSLK